MPVPSRPTRVGLLTLVLGCLLLSAPTLRPPTAAAAPTPETSTTHPYSDPTWFPLRAPAKIGCARSGCGTASDHGFDAIDLLGAPGDPVQAAGAGIVHVGGDSGSCSTSGEVEGGRWVWVDHGGGVVSEYRHLDTITIKEGQLVTPATRLGTMGHSGDVAPCTTTYLHFEVRHGGLDGERVDFGSLRGCGPQGAVQLPQALGFDSWNDPGLHPTKRLTSPALDSSCVTADWTTSPARPSPRLSRRAGAITVTLDAAARDAWAVDLEIWRPTLNAWTPVSATSLPAATSSTVFDEGVLDDHRYRVRVALHQGRGWSRWSSFSEVVGTPLAPPVRYLEWRRTTSSTKSYLHYGWSEPDTLGGAISGYTVARRCGTASTSLGSWKKSTAKAGDRYRNVSGLKEATVCEVRIRATNAAGTGGWSPVQSVTR